MDFPSELSWAHPVTQEWFVTKFGTPTEPQVHGWPSILDGKPTLISAPTGSGKTLAAFLIAIDKLLRLSIEGSLPAATQVVYVSPLKALSNDVQKNLDGPLAEIQKLALERGYHILNVDSTVILERPKLKDYRMAIRERLAETLRVDVSRVSVKFKTAEKVGPVGEGRSAEAQAIVTLVQGLSPFKGSVNS